MNSRVTIEAPAKINLRLIVLMPDVAGYHTLETIFCGISLADSVTLEAGDAGVHLEVAGGDDLGPADQNLVVRAANAFYDAYGARPAVRIRLEKRVPAAAGLGGGSSDAAATLRGLNAMHEAPLTRAQLASLGRSLGSDVPFFLTSTPYALAWGRGERLLELEPLPSRPVLVAHPGTAIPTPAAFRRLDELRGGALIVEQNAIPAEALRSWSGVQPLAANDLELVAFERVPRLIHAVRDLFNAGAEIALLAGSGSAIFGIFASEGHRDTAESILLRQGFTTWCAETLSAWPGATLQD